MVNFTVENSTGERQQLTIPLDMGLSLMEALRANEYPILAICGGMALCATCHVAVLAGAEHLTPLSDSEFDLLDTLPDAGATSRLACQLRIGKEMEGALFKLRGEEQ